MHLHSKVFNCNLHNLKSLKWYYLMNLKKNQSFYLTECLRKRQKVSEMKNHGFWRDLAGLTHPWGVLTSQNSFGLRSTMWAWEPRLKCRVTNKINIFTCCSNYKILLNLSFWACLKKFGSKKFFDLPTGGALWQKKFTFFARQLRNSKFVINPFTNI